MQTETLYLTQINALQFNTKDKELKQQSENTMITIYYFFCFLYHFHNGLTSFELHLNSHL